jgi:adenosylhomocysteine nucleosidase
MGSLRRGLDSCAAARLRQFKLTMGGLRRGLDSCAAARLRQFKLTMGGEASARVAIVAALEREVRGLIRTWRVCEKEYQGRRFRFFENGEVVLVCGGIGAEAARRAADAVIALYSPRFIYSAGFAGALDPSLKVGDLMRPARLINAGDGSSVALEGGEGVLVSFGAVASAGQKAKLRASYGAQAVDMEAGAVARAAEARGIRFGAIKVISDASDFEFPSMERFVDGNGKFSEGKFAVFAAIRPWLWPRVARLMRNSKRACAALCEALGKIDADGMSAAGRTSC